MKIVTFLISLLLFCSCASLKDQVKSRELLAKCTYELKRVDVESIDFDKMIELSNSAKKVDFKNPDKSVIPLLKEIKDQKFELNLAKLDFEAVIGVTNPNSHEVILDSLFVNAFLDNTKFANVIHDGPMVIQPNSEGELKVIVAMPTTYRIKNILDAENIVLKGKVWLKIELIKGLPFTIPFEFEVKEKVPREQIQKMVDEQKEKVVKKIVKELAGDKAKNLLDKF